MNEQRGADGGGGKFPSSRANYALWTLTAIMIATAGGITASVSAPPSPLVGLSFALSSLIFVAALVLAARVTIALERARRRAHPARPISNPFPALTKLLRRK